MTNRRTFLAGLAGLAGDPRKPLGQLDQPVEPRRRIAPHPRDHQLVVRPQLDRALQPLGIGDQPGWIRELVIVERNQCALGSDIDLGNMRLDRLALDLDQLDQVGGG